MSDRLFSDYLLVDRPDKSLSEQGTSFAAFTTRMREYRDRLPPMLFDFVINDWHYDHRDKRALHDMRLLTCAVADRDQAALESNITIDIKLLGAYNDRMLHLRYIDVQAYRLGLGTERQTGNARPLPTDLRRSHGDVLIDEAVVKEDGLFLHAIEFTSGTIFEIAFRGAFTFVWTPLNPQDDKHKPRAMAQRRKPPAH